MIENISMCTGCSGCKNICPVNSIGFIQSEEGFLYPKIDTTKCINCHLCEKVCPVNEENLSKLKFNFKQKCYALYAKDFNIRKKSSSGGMFSLIAEYVLSKNGYVFGAKLDKEFYLSHVGIEKKDDLDFLRGSKYFQSDVSKSFPEIKKLLTAGKMVYFCGTPCQVSGLKLYLVKNFENLITSDLVCHGVPSQKFFLEYKDYIEKKEKAKLKDFRFRKFEGWGEQETEKFIKGDKKITVVKPDYCSPYLHNFLKANLFRESCYSCKFSKPERYGDFTIGDFWGIQSISKMDYEHGVSLVLINSEKANMLFENIKDKVYFEDADFNMAAKFNPNLIKPSERPYERNGIYNKLNLENPFENDFKIKNPLKKHIRFYLISLMDILKIKRIIKKVLGR